MRFKGKKNCFWNCEKHLGKGENAGEQHFLLFPKCFQKPPSSGSLKVELCGKELRLLETLWKPAFSSFSTMFSTLPKIELDCEPLLPYILILTH